MNTDKDLQVASVMMDPNNGKILALVGGRDYSSSQYNRAYQSTRQVGSTMKPILYYAALENGFTSSTTFMSSETTFTFPIIRHILHKIMVVLMVINRFHLLLQFLILIIFMQ